MNTDRQAIEPRKQQIINAALRVFMDKGIVQASMNEIIIESGLSKGGVYHHFASKDDLIFGVVDIISEMKKDAIRQMISKKGSVRERLEFMIKMMMASLGNTKNHNERLSIDMMTLTLTNEKLSKKMAEVYEETIQLLSELISAGIQTGEFYQHVKPRQVAIGISAIFSGLEVHRFYAKSEVDSIAIGIETTQQLIDGITVKHKP